MNPISIYTLTFLFTGQEVLLVDSGRFPGLYNGIGSLVPADLPKNSDVIKERVKIDLLKEVGIDLHKPIDEPFALLMGDGYEVHCFRIFWNNDNPDEFDFTTADDEDRLITMVPLDGIYHHRHELAPRVPMLIAAALDVGLDPLLVIEA